MMTGDRSLPTTFELALEVQRLAGEITQLEKDRDELIQKVAKQDELLDDLRQFKTEVRTGTKVFMWLGATTIAILGALSTIFSNQIAKWF